MFSISRVSLGLLAGMLPALALADLPRPLDERHTARLFLEALQSAHPDLTAAERFGEVSVAGVNNRPVLLNIKALHESLRNEPSGAIREAVMQAYVARVWDESQEGQNAQLRAVTPNHPETALPVVMRIWSPQPKQFDYNRPPSQFVFPPGFAITDSQLQISEHIAVFWISQPRDPRAARISRFPNFFTSQDRVNAGINEQTQFALGQSHIATTTARLRPMAIENSNLHEVKGLYASSLLLLNSFWDNSIPTGSRVVAAVPRQGILLWTVDPSPEDIAALRKLAQSYAPPEIAPERDPAAIASNALWNKMRDVQNTRAKDGLPLSDDMEALQQELSALIRAPATSELIDAALFERIGPQEWDKSGWKVLPE